MRAKEFLLESKLFILYINGKPAVKYQNEADALRDIDHLRRTRPDAQLELKQEVCDIETIRKINEINSRDELTVPEELVQRFTTAGWEIAGEGRDQIVLGKPNSKYVLKIVGQGSGSRIDQIRRYINFYRRNQRDPHWPRVGGDRTLKWGDKTYYAYTQEKLQHLPGDEAVLDYLEYAMEEVSHGEEPDFSKIPPGLSEDKIVGLMYAVDDLFSAGIGDQHQFDLGNVYNIMQRDNGQLVIVDPFAGWDDDNINESPLASKSPLPVSQTMDHPNKQIYYMKTRSGEYQIVFHIFNKDENYDGDVEDDSPPGYLLDILLLGRDPAGTWTQRNTNVGEKQVAQIFATIAQLAAKIIKSHPNIDEIEIRGADAQRSRIYSRLMQQNVDSMLPGWKLSGAGLIKQNFTIENLIAEEKYVYRIDSERIPDFSKDLKTYYHNADFSASGRDWWPKAKGKITGIYAKDKLFTALYSTGSSSGPNATRYVAIYNTKPPVVYFDRKDIPRLQQNQSYLTVFDASRFKKLPSGEWFSSSPGLPVYQTKISDPFGYIKKTGWKIEIVDDLESVLKDIKKTAGTKGIQFGAEGLGLDEVKILDKVKGKGSEPGQLPKFGRPIKPDQETWYLGSQVGKMGAYQIWRDWLGGQLSYHLFDLDTRTVILTTFGSRYQGNPNSYIIHGLYASPGNPVKAHQFYRVLILDQGLTLISDNKQSPGGNKVWQKLEAYPDVNVYGFDTKTGELLNFGARDSEMYAIPSKAANNPENKYLAKNIRLVATAK